MGGHDDDGGGVVDHIGDEVVARLVELTWERRNGVFLKKFTEGKVGSVFGDLGVIRSIFDVPGRFFLDQRI